MTKRYEFIWVIFLTFGATFAFGDFCRETAERKLTPLELALCQRITHIRFENKPLGEVLGRLQTILKVPFSRDPVSMEEVDANSYTLVSGEFTLMEGRRILRKLLQPLGLTYVFKSETLHITSIKEALKNHCDTREYVNKKELRGDVSVVLRELTKGEWTRDDQQLKFYSLNLRDLLGKDYLVVRTIPVAHERLLDSGLFIEERDENVPLPPNSAVEAALERTDILADFVDVPLLEILDAFRAQTGIRFVVDTRAVESEGIHIRPGVRSIAGVEFNIHPAPLTIQSNYELGVRPISFRSTLELLLDPLLLVFVPKNHHIWITSKYKYDVMQIYGPDFREWMLSDRQRLHYYTERRVCAHILNAKLALAGIPMEADLR